MKITRKEIEIIKTNTNAIRLQVLFPFNTMDLNFIRSFQLKRFHPEGKYWTVPFTPENIRKLVDNGWVMGDELKQHLNTLKQKEIQKEEKLRELESKLPDFLYPFQKEGVLKLFKFNGRALLADDMGLGKTIQSLIFLKYSKLYPCLIICPASLKLNWKKEIMQWLQLPESDTYVAKGTTPSIVSARIMIINYDIVSTWMSYFVKSDFKLLILDEAHYVKNNDAQRTKVVKMIAKRIPHVIAISGTAVVSKPIEIYNTISIINPKLFPSRWNFGHRYCNARHNGFGWSFNGISNSDELHSILKESLMIRRKKEEVLKELPDKTYTIIPIELDNYSEYKRAEEDIYTYIKNELVIELQKIENDLRSDLQVTTDILQKDMIIEEKLEKISQAPTLVQIEVLKQLAVKGILNTIFDWIDNFIESGEKLVLFAVHRWVIDALMKRYGKKVVRIDGSVPIEQRQQIVEKFQNDKNIRIFVGNIKAAGVGLTLTASNTVTFIEYPWTPGDLQQAEDRVHRIGQKNNVQIFYFVPENTVIVDILKLLSEKKKMIEAVLDGIPMDVSLNIYTELLEIIKKR